MLAVSLRKITPYLTGSIALLYVLLCATQAQAQYNTHFDQRKFNLGFTMGLNIADVKLEYGGFNYSDPQFGELKDINVYPSPGFNIGLITNIKLHRNFDLRFIPQVALQERQFDFITPDSTYRRKLEAAYLDMPLFIKFKSDFYNNTRVYVMFGPQFSVNLMSNKKVMDDPNLVKIVQTDLSLVTAVGVDLYGDRVKLAPEIRYAIGLGNIFVPEGTLFGGNIKRIFSQSITISFNFE